MSYREDYELGGLSRFENPAIAEGLETLDSFREQRAQIALNAAQHIVEAYGGETTDLRLYYAAMFGRSYDEGIYEHDPNLLVPLGIARTLSRAEQEGQPLLVRAVNYPDDNVDVGVVGSFSAETFEPVKFEVELEEKVENFFSWRGGLAIAMRKVEPKRDSEERDYELADDVSKLVVCDTATWVTLGRGGLEVHPKGTGGVEVGEVVHLNSEHGVKYHQKLAFWLRQYLAPTERKELSPDLLRFKESNRRVRQESAVAQGVSEAVAAAQGLSPTIAAFFDKVKPYAEGDEPAPIDTKALFQEWRDAYDAQSLLAELELRELVEEDESGQLVVSSLGREALGHLHEV
jgi:hypothetical protein